MPTIPGLHIPWAAVGTIFLALVVFRLVAGIAKPPFRRVVGALAGVVLATGLNIALDGIAFRAGWWWSAQERPLAPLWTYLAQQILFSGAGGLVGWRIGKKSGRAAFCAYAIFAGAVGPLRNAIASTIMPLMQFGDGLAPYMAAWIGWFLILFLAQVVMALVAGIRVETD